MFSIVALGLSVQSVKFWRKEAQPFISHVEKVVKEVKNPFKRVVKVLAGLHKLFPLVLDLAITFSLVAALGMSGSIVAVCMSLAMSNTISFFIDKEVQKYAKKTLVNNIPEYSPEVQQFSDKLDNFNARLFNMAHTGLRRIEKLVGLESKAVA